jgi:hypothetical protein
LRRPLFGCEQKAASGDTTPEVAHHLDKKMTSHDRRRIEIIAALDDFLASV